MITQNDIREYIKVRKQYEALEEQFKALKTSYIERIKTNEQIENGDLGFNLKSFEKTTTAYKEVVDTVANAIEGITIEKIKNALLDTLQKAMESNSKTTPQNRLDAVANEVVKVVKSKKVA